MPGHRLQVRTSPDHQTPAPGSLHSLHCMVADEILVDPRSFGVLHRAYMLSIFSVYPKYLVGGGSRIQNP